MNNNEQTSLPTTKAGSELIDKLAYRTAQSYLKQMGRRPLSTRRCECGKTISFNKTSCLACSTKESNGEGNKLDCQAA